MDFTIIPLSASPNPCLIVNPTPDFDTYYRMELTKMLNSSMPPTTPHKYIKDHGLTNALRSPSLIPDYELPAA